MSLIFQDSFDGLGNDQLSSKWNGGISGPATGIITGGRNGTKCLSIFDDGQVLVIPPNPSTAFIASFAFAVNALPSINNYVFKFRADPDTDICTVRINSLAGFSVCDGAGGLVASSANGLWFANSYGHLQIRCATHWIAPLGGSPTGTLDFAVEVKFNNITVITGPTLSGTSYTGALGAVATNINAINKLGFVFNLGGATIRYDDFYLVDPTTGAAPQNDYLGDLRSMAIFPNGVGAHSGFTPNVGGAANWTMVDENPDDGDTTYVGTNVAGTLDTYQFPVVSLPAGSLIYGVQHNQVARKDDAGSRSIASVCRPSTTDHVGTPDVSIGDTYDTYWQEWERNPDTGADWALADFNTGGANPTQFGPKCTV